MRTLLLFFAPVLLLAQSTAIPVDWNVLPEAVKVAAKKQKAPIDVKVSYVTVERSNSLFYEMKILDAKGHEKEIMFRPDGTIFEIEDENIPLKDIPVAARTAIQNNVGTAQLLKVDLLKRDGQTLYEGELMDNGTRKKVIVDSKGNRVE